MLRCKKTFFHDMPEIDEQYIDVADNKNVDPYIVASWDDKSETFDSPYGKVISELDAIFKKITVC